MSTRALNSFEKAEFLLDSATNGTLNFSVVGTYEGNLDKELVRKAVGFLQMTHPLLQMSPNSAEKVSHYVRTHAQCPLSVRTYEGPDQWKGIVASLIDLLCRTHLGQVAIASTTCLALLLLKTKHLYWIFSLSLTRDQMEAFNPTYRPTFE